MTQHDKCETILLDKLLTDSNTDGAYSNKNW